MGASGAQGMRVFPVDFSLYRLESNTSTHWLVLGAPLYNFDTVVNIIIK